MYVAGRGGQQFFSCCSAGDTLHYLKPRDHKSANHAVCVHIKYITTSLISNLFISSAYPREAQTAWETKDKNVLRDITPHLPHILYAPQTHLPKTLFPSLTDLKKKPKLNDRVPLPKDPSRLRLQEIKSNVKILIGFWSAHWKSNVEICHTLNLSQLPLRVKGLGARCLLVSDLILSKRPVKVSALCHLRKWLGSSPLYWNRALNSRGKRESLIWKRTIQEKPEVNLNLRKPHKGDHKRQNL